MQPPQAPDIRQQLDKIFSSAKFKDAGRSRRFLEFIVVESLAGNSGDLKENVVGVSVFDRPADYDPRLDSIVRVEAGRLRTKLNDYYEQEGRDDRIVVTLPKGSYAPEFSWRTESQADTEPATPAKKTSIRHLLLGGIAALVVATATVAILQSSGTPQERIAVLPFTPYSNDERDRIVADRLTQKVTAEFVKMDTFDVVPSTSARRYEDRRPSIRDIATALQADVILEARTTTQGDKVNVEVRLSSGTADRKFWVGDEFVGEDIDKLANQIAIAASHAVTSRR